MWKSFKEYRSTVWRHWLAWAVGVGATLLGVGLDVVSSFVDFNFTVPAWLWVGVAAVAFAVASFLAFHDVRKERDTLKNEISGLLKANEPRLSFFGLSCIPAEGKRGGQIVRIEIRNVNGPDIQNCQVNLDSLTKRDGTEVNERIPVAICTERNIDRKGGISSRFNLSRGQRKHLYFAISPQAQSKYKPRILTEIGQIVLPGPGKYIALLTAVGGNAQPALYTVELDYKIDGQLNVTEVHTDDGAPYRQERGLSS